MEQGRRLGRMTSPVQNSFSDHNCLQFLSWTPYPANRGGGTLRRSCTHSCSHSFAACRPARVVGCIALTIRAFLPKCSFAKRRDYQLRHQHRRYCCHHLPWVSKPSCGDGLQDARTELAHVNRIATLGELTAAIAHKSTADCGAVTNAEAALSWLDEQPPNLEEIRQALDGVVADGKRAGEICPNTRPDGKAPRSGN